MADVKKHIYLRDTRDRLLDLLGLGETYPVRDLPVGERLKVPYGSGAKIPVPASQRDCVYSLWSRAHETPVTRASGGAAAPCAAHGTGGTILIESPGITESTGYRIRALRETTGRWDYLHEVPEITVGLDTRTLARVLTGAWLDERLDAHAASDARVVDHGAVVEVEIPSPQHGVIYRLVRVAGAAWETISQEDAPSALGPIVLRTVPMTQDTTIRVLVISTVGTADQELLDITLPIVIRPARDRSVSVTPGPHVGHLESATVVIGGSQPGVRYQLHAMRLGADDLLFGAASTEASPEEWAEIDGEEGRVFHAARRTGASTWVELPGFAPISAPADGSGAALSIPTDPLADDCMIVVRAFRDVTLSDGATVTLAVPLLEEAIALVRPDPAPALRIQALVAGATTSGAIAIAGGQRGVFYHLRTSAAGADLGKPAYFYERRGEIPEVNRGLGALRVGTDLVVGRDAWTDLTLPELRGIEAQAVEVNLAISGDRPGFALVGALERATALPVTPIVDTPPLAMGTTLYLRAVKGRTRLSQALASTAAIMAPPALSAQVAQPDGPIAGVVVAASRAGEVYSLLVNGAPDGGAQAGNGQDLTLAVSTPQVGAIVEVRIARGQAPAIVVEEICRVVAS